MTLLSSKETAKALGVTERTLSNVFTKINTAGVSDFIYPLINHRVVKVIGPATVYFYPESEISKVKLEIEKSLATICQTCGKTFRRKHKDEKTCSESCRAKYKREYQRQKNAINRAKRLQNRPQALAATKTPSKSSEKPQKAYSENKSNFFKSIQPTNEYGMPSDYQTGQQTVNTQHLCECGRSANPFTGKCSTCAIQSRYRQMQPIRMKGI